MTAPPRVSVVLIFWNAERFLAEAIESVLEQSGESWELLLVDDGSTDGGAALAIDRAGRYPDRVSYLRHEGGVNRGMSASRNLGIERARGEYVAFLDADDVWLPAKLAAQTGILDSRPDVSLVYGPVMFWFGWTGNPDDAARDSIVATGFPPDHVVSAPELFLRFLRGSVPVPVLSSAIARRRLFDEVGAFETAFRGMYEDQVFLAKVALRSEVFVESVCRTKYRQHPDSCCETSIRTGEYAFDRPNPSERAFAEWLDGYVSAEGFDQGEVREVVREKVRPYRHPILDRLRRGSVRLLAQTDESVAGLGRSAVRLGRRAAGGPAGTITAAPNPIRVSDRSRVGMTTLTWSSERTTEVEVRVGAPDGALFSRTGPSGSAATGKWVGDGTTFYLQDASEEGGQDARRTLATVTLRVDGSPIPRPPAPPERSNVSGGGRGRHAGARVKTLVTGWFSFPGMGATAGDLLARDLLCEWLEKAGRDYDVALAPPFAGGVDWREVDPGPYSHVAFVCGPFSKVAALQELLGRFSRAKLVAVNVSLVEERDRAWRSIDVLFERDGPAASRPDITFLSRQARVPVVGLVRVAHAQPEYGDRGMHDVADAAIDRLLASRRVAVVSIDTRLDANETGLRSPAEIESLIARMDVVVTTRLHGMVFALKNGVPALAVDPIRGGAKVRRQAETIGWPAVFLADALDDEALGRSFDFCLSAEARLRAVETADRAAKMVENVRDQLVLAMAVPGETTDV
ncbi:MAG TPA: glycosyltransferase [Thermoanaerobaculia bacterium]|nr:glycosyltransferase [Thermoanaerobaculia bacterium]